MVSGGGTTIDPSSPRRPLGHGMSSTTVSAGLVIREIKPWEVTYLRGDEDVLPRNPALPDRVSNLLFVLYTDVSLVDLL